MKINDIDEYSYSLAEERAQNYIDCYLPSWALNDWEQNDTDFLRNYIQDIIKNVVSDLNNKV